MNAVGEFVVPRCFFPSAQISSIVERLLAIYLSTLYFEDLAGWYLTLPFSYEYENPFVEQEAAHLPHAAVVAVPASPEGDPPSFGKVNYNPNQTRFLDVSMERISSKRTRPSLSSCSCPCRHKRTVRIQLDLRSRHEIWDMIWLAAVVVYTNNIKIRPVANKIPVTWARTIIFYYSKHCMSGCTVLETEKVYVQTDISWISYPSIRLYIFCRFNQCSWWMLEYGSRFSSIKRRIISADGLIQPLNWWHPSVRMGKGFQGATNPTILVEWNSS